MGTNYVRVTTGGSQNAQVQTGALRGARTRGVTGRGKRNAKESHDADAPLLEQCVARWGYLR